MKNEKSWFQTLISFASQCRWKMLFSVIGVFGGFVPFMGVYQILKGFIEANVKLSQIWYWCGVCAAGYVVKLVFFAISTILSHVSAYEILEIIRMEIADKLMKAPLGHVMDRRIGEIKTIVIDRVEAIEPVKGNIDRRKESV